MRESAAGATFFASFEPIEWVQEIRNYQGINVEGRHLTVYCKASADCNLLLNDRVDLRDLKSIPLVISDGQPTEKELTGLSQKAVGKISYIEDQNLVYGWFCLKNPDSYTAVWDQVRDGGYFNCSISLLCVGPVQLGKMDTWIWNANHSLSIETVSLRFTRKTNKPDNQTASDQTSPRTGLFGRRLAR